MTAKDLKNAILQEAVQGKLVPQIVSEGNAKDLLEQIKAEKAKLVKEGKIKKEKPLPEITEDEIPFDIPESWCWCRFSEIADFYNGDRGSNYPNKNEYVEKGIAWINTGHITSDNYLSQEKMNFITEKKYLSLNKSGNIQKGDLVYCLRGATFGKVARVEPFEEGAIASSLMIIRLKNISFREYILLYLKSHLSYEQLHIYDNGSAQPNLAAKDVAKYLIPLPPLAEQKRIVAAIEKFMPLIEEYGKKETVLNELNAQIGTLTKKAILQEAVQGKLVPQIASEGNAKDLLEQIKVEKAKLVKEGKIKKEKPLPEITEDEIPFDIPENWCWCRLGEVGNTTTGSTPSKSNQDYFGDFIDFLSPGDIQNSIIKYGKQGLSKSGYEVSRPTPKGTILQVCIGGSIGKCAITDREVTFNQQINGLTPIFSLSEYLFTVLSSDYFYKKITGNSTGTATPIINKSAWELLLIPLPPLSEQKRIVEAIEKLLPYCEKLGRE